MKFTGELQSWLPRSMKIRSVIAALAFVIACGIEQISPIASSFHPIEVWVGVSSFGTHRALSFWMRAGQPILL